MYRHLIRRYMLRLMHSGREFATGFGSKLFLSITVSVNGKH